MGDRDANLGAAREMIAQRTGRIIAASGVEGSEPWGSFEEGDTQEFMNQVLVVETGLEPLQLLDELQRIEKELGRDGDCGQAEYCSQQGAISCGARRYRSRTMDIDILFFGDSVIDSPRLTVPHPLLDQREFVLRPLAQVVPSLVHPLTGMTPTQMLGALTDSK